MNEEETIEAMGEEIPPLPTMTFPQAIEEVITGKIVTRLEWKDPLMFIGVYKGMLCLKKYDGFHALLVSVGDMFAEDWVVLT